MTPSSHADTEALRERARAALLALVAGVLVLAGKIAAAWVTGSTAVLSDALESVVNVVSAAFLLYSIRLAAMPADRNHPYGHGKVEFFSAGFEGGMIVVAAMLILASAARAIWVGPELQRIGSGIALLVGFSVINGLLGLHLMRVGRRAGSIALRADGAHLLTDVLTTVGVIGGLVAVHVTGWTMLDPLVAIVVGLNILNTGWNLSREAISGLMDEADPEQLGEITRRLETNRRPEHVDVHSLRAWRSGALDHIDFHLTVPRYFDAEQLHEIDEQIKEQTFETTPTSDDIIIHFDPCRPHHCAGCAMEPCARRTSPLERPTPFDLDTVTRSDEELG